MKILRATVTATGHGNPGVPLVRRLVERGHEVRWYTSPRYKNLIESSGASYLPLETGPNRLVIPSIHGLADEDLLVIVTTKGQSPELETGRLPPNIHLEKFIPYFALMPHVDVMVTNGGYGGTLIALSHGIPIVCSGRTEDKAEVCQRLNYFGVGINLKSDAPKPEGIKNAVIKILNDKKFNKQAMRIQEDFAKYDAPTKAAELLEKFTSHRQIKESGAHR